jgi:hypothetical protein
VCRPPGHRVAGENDHTAAVPYDTTAAKVPLGVPHTIRTGAPILSRLGVPVGNICSCSQPCPCSRMFSVDETTAAAIRQAYEASGELSAVVELRRHFPGITDNESARRCVRAIAGWKPLAPSSVE